MINQVQRMFYRHIGIPDVTFEARYDSLYTTVMSSKAEGKTKSVLIYGDIVSDQLKAQASDYGVKDGLVSPTDVKTQLAEIEGKDIDLRINSRGGEVHAATGIYAILEDERRNGKEITARIDGLAASAASFVMLAANRIYAHRLSSVMIHRAHSAAVGNAVDLREYADFLEGQDYKVASVYAERMALNEDSALDLMTKETWYHGKSIVEAGLADEMLDKGADNVKAALEDRDHKTHNRMSKMALGLV